jgi:hypothetical protein
MRKLLHGFCISEAGNNRALDSWNRFRSVYSNIPAQGSLEAHGTSESQDYCRSYRPSAFAFLTLLMCIVVLSWTSLNSTLVVQRLRRLSVREVAELC